jgi:hypothetical protein
VKKVKVKKKKEKKGRGNKRSEDTIFLFVSEIRILAFW